jgi:hypothetical protein
MKRRVVPLLGVMLLGIVWTVQAADDPAKPKADTKSTNDIGVEQEILARQYQDFEKALLRLVQRMENSNKPEEKERAANYRKAIAFSTDKDVKGKFQKLIEMLRSTKSLKTDEIKQAMEESKMVADDIKVIIAMLLADTREDELKKERARLQELIRQLEEIIRKQKIVRAQTEAGKTEKKPLGEAQNKVTKSTEQLARALDKKDGKDGKDGKGEPKDGKGDGKGEPKDGKGEPKDGKDGKGQPGSGQPKSTKPGDKKDTPPQPNSDDNQQGQDGMPAKKQVQEANDYQKQAEKDIDKEDRKNASDKQDKALKALEEAKKKLEEILRQLREEEIERMLAALEARCQKMLQMQIEVRDGTVRVFRAIEENVDKKPSRANEQKALQLSDREQQIVDEATKAIQMLEAEGSAVAFPEVFIQVREDMRHVARRLGKADVGTVTQVIEEDIINTLKEMIEALKKAQQQLQANRSNPSQSPNQNQKLLDLLAELKMIRSMQVRVNSRTKVYGEKYQGEQADDGDIRHELNDLAGRQQKIFEVTDNIYRGKNK